MLALIKLWVLCELLPFGLFAISFVQQEPKWLISTLQSMSSAGADFKLCQGSLSLLPLSFLSWHFVLSDLSSFFFSPKSLTFAWSRPHASSVFDVSCSFHKMGRLVCVHVQGTCVPWVWPTCRQVCVYACVLPPPGAPEHLGHARFPTQGSLHLRSLRPGPGGGSQFL